MGSCMGRCFHGSDNTKLRNQHMFNRQDSGLDFTFLVEEDTQCSRQNDSLMSRLLSKRKDYKNQKRPVLELVEGILNTSNDSYSRLNESARLSSVSSCNTHDIPLQCLDARALLARTSTSTPINSLELEWEHEAVPVSMIHDPSGSSWGIFHEETADLSCNETATQNTVPANENNSDWSRVSSLDSLEWDNVHNSFSPSPPMSDIDTDTQILLSEIERLTTQALRETGHDLLR